MYEAISSTLSSIILTGCSIPHSFMPSVTTAIQPIQSSVYPYVSPCLLVDRIHPCVPPIQVRSIFGPHICGEGLDICGDTILTASWRPKDQIQAYRDPYREPSPASYPSTPYSVCSLHTGRLIDLRKSKLGTARSGPDLYT